MPQSAYDVRTRHCCVGLLPERYKGEHHTVAMTIPIRDGTCRALPYPWRV